MPTGGMLTLRTQRDADAVIVSIADTGKGKTVEERDQVFKPFFSTKIGPACRKQSKADSQRRWLQKPENRDYFRGPEHVLRVQRWRAAHPGYWRRAKASRVALQDPLSHNSL